MRQTGQIADSTDVTEPRPMRLPGYDGPITCLAELEKVLKPRTFIPTQRYARFLALDDETLARAGVTTRYAAAHLKRMLQDLRGHTGHVTVMLAAMDLGFFSLDHSWREVIKALVDAGPRVASYQLLAISNYRRYLLHCHDTLDEISTDRLQSALWAESTEHGEERTQLAAASRTGYDGSRKRQEVLVRDLVRLPKGMTLRLLQGRAGPFVLWLGKRRFRVESWSGASLVDERGNGAELHDGRNAVGRALYNDVIVDSQFDDVSRRHLILDLNDGTPCAITDLSSSGTFISQALVDLAA